MSQDPSGPAYMRLVTTEGERFAFIESVDDSVTPPEFRLGDLIGKDDLPGNASIFDLGPSE